MIAARAASQYLHVANRSLPVSIAIRPPRACVSASEAEWEDADDESLVQTAVQWARHSTRSKRWVGDKHHLFHVVARAARTNRGGVLAQERVSLEFQHQ